MTPKSSAALAVSPAPDQHRIPGLSTAIKMGARSPAIVLWDELYSLELKRGTASLRIARQKD